MENLLENEVLLEKIRALLGKLTPTTKDDVIKEFLSYKVFSAPDNVLQAIVGIIFDKAVETPRSCSLYIELCKQQVESELQEKRASKFRYELLNRTQNAFNKALLKIENTKEEQLLQAQLAGDDSKSRSRNFGIITMIGQMYRYSMLSTKLVQWCIYELLHHSFPVDGVPARPPYNEEFLQCAIELLGSVGRNLENAPDFNGKVYFDRTLDHLKGISTNCSSKTRFMVLDLIKLRSNLWLGRKITRENLTTLSTQLEEAKQGLEQAEAEKAELSKKLEEAKQGRQQAEADKVELRAENSALLAECAAGAISAICDQMQLEKLRQETSALLEECAAGSISAVCDQMQLEKLREDRSALIAECGVGSMSAICDQIQLEKVQSEKNLLSAKYEKALAETQANSVQLHFANRQIRKLKDEVNKFNAQENGKEKEENEVSEDVWHKKDALLIKDQCDEFKDAFELLHGAISSSLRNGMMASNEQILAENLSIAGKLAEKASSIRDGFMASTGTHVECIKNLLDDLLPCDDSAYSVTTENSDFEVIKE